MQKELGGKHQMLKAGMAVAVSTVSGSPVLTSTEHGLKVGDLFKFDTLGGITSVTAEEMLYVKEVVDEDTFKVSKTIGGAVVNMDAAESDLEAHTYKSLGGIRSKSKEFASEGVDITSEDSDEWTTMLDDAGIRSMNVSGEGVINDSAVFRYVEDLAEDNKMVKMCVIQGKPGGAFRVHEGTFKITSISSDGPHDAEGTFSISASSSGKIKKHTIAA